MFNLKFSLIPVIFQVTEMLDQTSDNGKRFKCKVERGGLTVKHFRPRRCWSKVTDRLAGAERFLLAYKNRGV